MACHSRPRADLNCAYSKYYLFGCFHTHQQSRTQYWGQSYEMETLTIPAIGSAIRLYPKPPGRLGKSEDQCFLTRSFTQTLYYGTGCGVVVWFRSLDIVSYQGMAIFMYNIFSIEIAELTQHKTEHVKGCL